jgi:hypothetical protein
MPPRSSRKGSSHCVCAFIRDALDSTPVRFVFPVHSHNQPRLKS